MTVETTSYGQSAGNWTRGQGVALTTVEWTSDASGDATDEFDFDGQIYRVVTTPGAGGLAPTTLYDVTLLDEDGHDILGGAGANRSATVSEQLDLTSLAPLVHYGTLTLTVAAAGDANAGTVKIYWR